MTTVQLVFWVVFTVLSATLTVVLYPGVRRVAESALHSFFAALMTAAIFSTFIAAFVAACVNTVALWLGSS